MLRGQVLSLLGALAIAAPVCGQSAPLTVCIVQTKTDKAAHYDPSAGPLAIEVYKQLSGKQLHNGTALKITVLPASLQNDILPEVRRLDCARVLQLWYSHSSPIAIGEANMINSSSYRPAFNSSPGADPEPAQYEDSLFYSLWDGATEKVHGRGSVPLHQQSRPTGATDTSPFATLAEQAIKWLSRVH